MMNIRELQKNDREEVVQLWLETSLKAHDFIPAEYWKKNKKKMADIYLPNSETYLAIKEGRIAGFISMADDYLAAVFVRLGMQGQGIGQELLHYVKQKRDVIQLRVYRENSRSVQFYKNQGFRLLSEGVDEETNHMECLMEWRKEP